MSDDTPLNHHVIKTFPKDVWLDGTDMDNEGQWEWSADGERIKTAYWANGEPNNSGDEACLEHNGEGSWNDMPCARKQKYLCKLKGIVNFFFHF